MRRKDREAKEDRKFVGALAKGLDVLNCFRPGDRVLGNSQIAERAGLSKPTVSRLTYTLSQLGYLKHRKDLSKYELGTAVIRLGYSLMAQMDVRRLARPLMQELAEEGNVSVNLGVRDRLTMVYIDTYRNTRAVAVHLDIGSHIPIATTSMGRACLAALPEGARAEILEEVRRNDPAGWPAVEASLEEALQEYRERGFCLSVSDWRPEVSAAAVPLAQSEQEVVVFSASGPSYRFSRKELEEDIGPRLLHLVQCVRTTLHSPSANML